MVFQVDKAPFSRAQTCCSGTTRRGIPVSNGSASTSKVVDRPTEDGYQDLIRKFRPRDAHSLHHVVNILETDLDFLHRVRCMYALFLNDYHTLQDELIAARPRIKEIVGRAELLMESIKLHLHFIPFQTWNSIWLDGTEHGSRRNWAVLSDLLKSSNWIRSLQSEMGIAHLGDTPADETANFLAKHIFRFDDGVPEMLLPPSVEAWDLPDWEYSQVPLQPPKELDQTQIQHIDSWLSSVIESTLDQDIDLGQTLEAPTSGTNVAAGGEVKISDDIQTTLTYHQMSTDEFLHLQKRFQHWYTYEGQNYIHLLGRCVCLIDKVLKMASQRLVQVLVVERFTTSPSLQVVKGKGSSKVYGGQS